MTQNVTRTLSAPALFGGEAACMEERVYSSWLNDSAHGENMLAAVLDFIFLEFKGTRKEEKRNYIVVHSTTP